MVPSGHHFVAVFGGAVAGSEAAFQLASRGFRVAVFDQNTLPYGKIEDGLPKWHDKLRDKEEQRINEKLSHPHIHYVPNTGLGKQLDFQEVASNWGFSAILLATGAWKDRPLPIPEAQKFVNQGLYYQNPLVYWFNHYHEPGYSGPQYHLKDDAMVIGGGLASLDVVKILMIELVQKALAERGHQVDMFTLDRGINRVLDDLGYSLPDLGLKGCTLFYRRRDLDMPLSPLPTDTPEQLKKAQMVRKKIMDNFLRKYLFKFEPCWAPLELLHDGETVTGMLFQKTEIVDNRVVPVQGNTKEFYAPLIISSIGSLPEPIEGIPTRGSVFEVDENDCCRMAGYDNVFALGNAVTGRGNIKESLQHGRITALDIMDSHLKWQQEDYQEWLRNSENQVQAQVSDIADQVSDKSDLHPDTVAEIFQRIRHHQQQAGYSGEFKEWVDKNLPVRLEELLEESGE